MTKRLPQAEFDALMDELTGNSYSISEALEICKRAMGWSTKQAAMEMLDGFESGELELSVGNPGEAMDRLLAIIGEDDE